MIHLSSVTGRSSQSRGTQISIPPAIFTSCSWIEEVGHQVVPKPAERFNLSSVSLICPRDCSIAHIRKSKFRRCSGGILVTCSSHVKWLFSCVRVAVLLWASPKQLNSSSYLWERTQIPYWGSHFCRMYPHCIPPGTECEATKMLLFSTSKYFALIFSVFFVFAQIALGSAPSCPTHLRTSRHSPGWPPLPCHPHPVHKEHPVTAPTHQLHVSKQRGRVYCWWRRPAI